MVKVTKWDGYIIADKVVFGATEPNKKLINLASTIWADTRYKSLDYTLVDYPGEYDVSGVVINCYMGKWDKLNYVVSLEKKKIWIFQSPEVIENEDIWTVNEWLYTDDKISEKIDQLELEWEKKKLD